MILLALVPASHDTGSIVRHHYWHWPQHQVMLKALSAAPLHSSGQNNQNEVQHDLFGHVVSLALALASTDADSVINDMITFLSSG